MKQKLEELYKLSTEGEEKLSRKRFLCQNIFKIYTYDDEMDEVFCDNMIKVLIAIKDRTTFDFIKNKNQYGLFLTMCHMPFLAEIIDWGGSIRGAWINNWNNDKEYDCGRLTVKTQEFDSFIEGIIEFYNEKK